MTAPKLASYYTEKDDDGRAYCNPVRRGPNGEKLWAPSITTVLKAENKDSLIQWAANQSVEWCVQNAYTLLRTDEESGIRRAKYRWRDFRSERAEVGTGIHETIEQEHTGGWDFPSLDAEQVQIMARWREFNEAYDVEPVLTEVTVWNYTHNYAGTADGLWWVTDRMTGERTLTWIDLKTSKNTWPAHWMQGAAIVNAEAVLIDHMPEVDKPKEAGIWPEGMWTEEPMPDTVKFAVVHLRADKWDFLEGEDLDLYFQEFLCYRGVHAAKEARKKRVKDREADALGGAF